MTAVRALTYAQKHRPRFVVELKEFIRFPSVSNQPSHAADVRRCATWLARHLHDIGLEHVRIFPTTRHPIVYADWLRARHAPTLLVYGHYDVQPAEPLEAWNTPPFQPVVRGKDLYGRGSCDDKGQMFTHLKALESYLKTSGKLPVNVKCVFEGEEEMGGSPSLREFVTRNSSSLRSDTALVSDTRMLGPGQPAIGYSQRGNVRFEIEVQGQHADLHSGNFGGVVHNPLQVLCEILASLHDSAGRVAIPGFYETVREWDAAEREYMFRAGPKDEEVSRQPGVTKNWGDPGYSLYERITIRPALTINGIGGGYQGPGIKTVIPARAVAKLSIRIVPDQDPPEIDKLFREFIARISPTDVRISIRTLATSYPALVNRRHPALGAAAFAYRRGFGAQPVFLRSGGSVPAAAIFQRALGIPTVLMGFALPDDHVHAPNEKFHLPNFFHGIETSIWFMAAASQLRKFDRQQLAQEARTE